MTEINTPPTGLCAVITGDPIGGFQLWGPFECESDAVDWADRTYDDKDWWVILMEPPFERGK